METLRKTLPSDVGYQWTAMSYQEKLTGNQLYYLFGLSVLLVYLCLAGQYELDPPLAVLSAVPLRHCSQGPVIALTSLGVTNNLYTQIGLILMIAVDQNGILIVEMAREGRLVHG
jgi:HAE1 family hydrophobic/amphiphilic exporter-1